MEYPSAVLEKAKRLEQLLQGVAAGEPLDEVNEALGLNLDDWVAHSYFDPSWHNLSLEKATQMVYRKAGRVTWHSDRIEVMLEPYRYSDQQRAMQVTCARFNAARLRWRDGRLLRISVASPGKF